MERPTTLTMAAGAMAAKVLACGRGAGGEREQRVRKRASIDREGEGCGRRARKGRARVGAVTPGLARTHTRWRIGTGPPPRRGGWAAGAVGGRAGPRGACVFLGWASAAASPTGARGREEEGRAPPPRAPARPAPWPPLPAGAGGRRRPTSLLHLPSAPPPPPPPPPHSLSSHQEGQGLVRAGLDGLVDGRLDLGGQLRLLDVLGHGHGGGWGCGARGAGGGRARGGGGGACGKGMAHSRSERWAFFLRSLSPSHTCQLSRPSRGRLRAPALCANIHAHTHTHTRSVHL